MAIDIEEVEASEVSLLEHKINGLSLRFDNEIDQLKSQNQLILKRMEATAGKFKSYKDIKEELKGFFSIDGYSQLLDTRSLFKKVFWLSCMIALFVSGMLLIVQNVKEYQSHDVVTQIKVVDVEMLIFPAITFCFSRSTLSDLLLRCYFDTESNKCTTDDFEYFEIKTNNYEIKDRNYQCYKFNGGRNFFKHKTNILWSSYVGFSTGLTISFNSSYNGSLFYYIGDTNVRPTRSEIYSNIVKLEDGKNLNIEMKKSIDNKLPKPHSNCSDHINSETSYLVKEIIQNNQTYRQKPCYDMCHQDYLKTYARSRNISIFSVNYVNFDFQGNCSHICPLECSSTTFDHSKVELQNSGPMRFSFFYSDRKYTEISQSIKTTEADLISNSGGVLGLFLELSFISAYRFIIYIFDFLVLA